MPNLAVLALDVLAIAVLVYGLYFRRHGRRDMLVAFAALNVGAMALAATLASHEVGTGLGLGLFGVLSIIRLRSSEIAHEEVAYYFVSLALGLLAGFQPDPAWLAPVLATLLIGVIYVVDHPKLAAGHRRLEVTLDAAYPDETVLIAHLEELLDAEVTNVVVNELDLVRDLTVVDVRFRRRTPSPAKSESASPPAAAASTKGVNGHSGPVRKLAVGPARVRRG
jgi:hypothetical protein